ncbi:MAG: response regulator [Chloroflexi bacterium]|nr:response regulator [Chloroflexota bacterium]
MRVLVVEDDPAIGKLVALILQADAHHVVAVTSGEQALAQLRADRFDVVLSDLGFGAGMNGLDLCRVVRHSWPGIRFVLATGSITMNVDQARRNGVDELLTKPFRSADLRRAVLAGRRPSQGAQAA